MERKTCKFKLFAAAIFAMLALAAGTIVFTAQPVKAAASYELVYSQSDENVVTGITITGGDSVVADIPENVTEIADAAFAGAKISGVNFAPDAKLNKIGDSAFEETELKEIKLPEGLVEIGAGAFAYCHSLNSVVLPDSLQLVGQRAFNDNANELNVYLPNNTETVYETGAFGESGEVVLISENSEVIEAIKQALGDSAPNVSAAYPVTIRYNYLGTVVDTETRLFGKPYNFAFVGGVWKTTELDAVGTVSTRGKRWYASADAQPDKALTVADMTRMLAEDGVTEIDLYSSIATGDIKVFIARNDIVYDGTSYRLDSLAPLLMPISDRITGDMTVSIKSYTKPDANEPVADENIPAAVCDAGSYEMQVEYGADEPATFTINIARKKINLASYDSLFWKISSIGGIASDANLMSASDATVYLYKKTTDGAIVPSNVVLSDEKANELGVDKDDYDQKVVRYSLARKRDGAISLKVAANEAYTAEYADETGTEVGKYVSSATLTPTDNYEFELRTAPADALKRGVTVRIGDDGKAVATKEWYIVDVNNWVVDSTGKEYEISAREYGAGRFPMPKLAHEDTRESYLTDGVLDTDYGKPDVDKVYMTLFYEGEQIGDVFMRDEFNDYLHASMPAGNYTLNFDVQKLIAHTQTGTDASGNPIYEDVSYDPFEYSISFTVEKAKMRIGYVNNIDGALKGKTFTYKYNATVHTYEDDEVNSVANALDGLALDRPVRSSVWLRSEYDKYFGDVRIEYNLRRWQTDEYSATVDTIEPDEYTVYYRIYAPNYLSSVESDTSGADRNDYYFKVVIVREILLPEIKAKKYNGELQTAEIEPNDIYYIIENDGGISAGSYDVVLKFRNPACYMWQGDDMDSRSDTVTLTFEIEQAVNGWVSEIGIQNWIVGRYDPDVNKATGSARFGNDNKHIVITDGSGNVVFDSAAGINKLNGAKAGTYGLRVVIAETDDYTGVSDSVFFRIYEKAGLAWWITLIIVVGSLGAAALVLFILYKKGVFELLTGKITLAIRTKATVDATIAAVRASKMAEEARISIANAEAKERAQKRKAAAEAEKALPVAEKAAALEAKAKAAAERAEKMRAKSEAMLSRAERMREEATKSDVPADNDVEQEAAATVDDGNTPTEE